MRPNENEYGAYYHGYIQKVPTGTIVENLENCIKETVTVLKDIPEEKGDYRYAEGKWTIKELLQHMVDVERVMSYRALRVGRGDQTPIPGFDQDEYVLTCNAADRTVADLTAEFQAIRQATIHLFEHFTDEMLLNIGNASGNPISTRALGFILIGHELHHMNILKERYL